MKELIKNIRANFFIPNIVYVLMLGFTVRLAFSSFGTLHQDQGSFIAWSINLASNGFEGFYNSWSDYLPGYLYILFFLGKIRGFIPDEILYKLPSILVDVITAHLIFKIVKEKKNKKMGLIGASLYLFNPAIFGNSTLWGQVDSFVGLFSLVAVYLLPKQYYLSAVALAIGTLIKPQVAFLLPIVFYDFWKSKRKFSQLVLFGVIGLTVFLLGFWPFNNQNNFFEFLASRLSLSANQYPYTAINAFNFWGLFGQWKLDNLYFQFGGYILFLILITIFAIKTNKKDNFYYLMASFVFSFTFLFFTRMHERHMFPIFAPLTVLAAVDFIYLVPLIGLSLVYILNLLYSYKWITEDFLVSFEPFPVIILALTSFIVFVYSTLKEEKFRVFISSTVKFFNKGRKKVEESLPKLLVKDKTVKILLVLILLFAFGTRVYRLATPEKDYFDEIYHAFTARLVLHADPKAWEWWNPHPEGFAYEWTHPPLSKLAMAASMKIFGENSFGWRFPQVIAGTLSVYLIYLLSKKLFNDEALSLMAAFIFSLDGLGLTLTRMGMNDGYVVLFMLLAVYLFLKEKDFWAAISLGLSLASKWSALWCIPILFVLWLKRKNKFKLSTFAWFLALPVGVYLLSYFQMFTTGHDLGTWWGMQQQMWWYHTGLDATHPYTSPWWSWPLDVRPVYLYTSDEINGFVGRIYAIGNPFLFWFGLFSIFSCLLHSFYEKNNKLGLIVFSYLIFFAPWAASPRIMFMYHYYPSIPFLAIAAAYILRRNTKYIYFILPILFISFLYFYPHWTALQIPLWLDKSYYWMGSWR